MVISEGIVDTADFEISGTAKVPSESFSEDAVPESDWLSAVSLLEESDFLAAFTAETRTAGYAPSGIETVPVIVAY